MAELHGLWQLLDREHSSSAKWPPANQQQCAEQNQGSSSHFVPDSCALPLHLVGLQKKNGQQLQERQISATVTPATSSVSSAATPASHPAVELGAAGSCLSCRLTGNGGGCGRSIGRTGMHQHWLERQKWLPLCDSSQQGWKWSTPFLQKPFCDSEHPSLNH